MGFKSLTLQMVPVCLHASIQPEEDLPFPKPTASPAAVRLILSTGRIRIFRRSFPAEELMASNPLHLVCRSDSLFIGTKVPPLAAGDLLTPGQSYFLLPSNFFSSPLSFVSLASSFSSSSPSKLLLLRPFEIQKTGEGKLQLRVSDEFVERLGEEEEEEGGEGKKKEGMVCTTEEMERDYRELVVRAKLWKPKLETISELERKRRGGSVVGFTGMMRKEKRGHSKELKT
ncbi:uncharacterized protein LOC110036336 [Phalaenopsis equestris]|uniref:uncharacterized protein LOC110036336 n=1 Tax=Phalaenopsis equestris TaxID=78828 RepID=UPI0009E1B611|nr:uncharacterized protein LOC110036336 [Phalaenopsis equestris]